MGDLHSRRILITIDCDDFDPEPLRLNGNFFAEFSRTQQEQLLRLVYTASPKLS